MNTRRVVVTGAFDNVRSAHLRVLEEAAKLGPLTVLLWPDDIVRTRTGAPPKFPLAERKYFLEAVRFVDSVEVGSGVAEGCAVPETATARPEVWAVTEPEASEIGQAWARERGMDYVVLRPEQLSGFPEPPPSPFTPGRKKVIVTGCYDWFHSGHVRFFEEVSAYGDLYVVVGHDANIRLLKGEGHPLFPQAERRYLAGAIRHVKQALVSSGDGWVDADPEIRRLAPDIYAVNEDGDRGGKREYCQKMGIEYLVLKRTPAPGLPPRSSTDLRGF